MKTSQNAVAASRRIVKRPATVGRGKALLGSAAALLAALALTAPASAAPFQQYLNGNCVTGATCKINFASVPAGKRLLVDSVSCYLRVVAEPGKSFPEIKFEQMLVVGASSNKVVNALTLTPLHTAFIGDEAIYAATHTVTAFANANQRFQAVAELDKAGFSQFACHISGDMSKVS
jgi:hypothetical protein